MNPKSCIEGWENYEIPMDTESNLRKSNEIKIPHTWEILICHKLGVLHAPLNLIFKITVLMSNEWARNCSKKNHTVTLSSIKEK